MGLSFPPCPRLRTLASLLTLCTFCDMTRCSATAWSRMRTHYWSFVLSLVCSLCFSSAYQQHLSVPCIITMAKWSSHWKPFWVPYGDGFKKVDMEEWEQGAHVSKCSGWEPGQRWTQPSPWSWKNQDLSDEETFSRLTHESSDGSESNCGSNSAPKPVDSNDISVDTFNRTDDGWGSFCDPQQFPPG